MQLRNTGVKRVLDYWPGKKRFGVYRFLPLFFVLGAVIEFSMINWQVGEVNFYRVFRERQAKERALKKIALEKPIESSAN